MRTEVAITVDTEFSIAGAFEDFNRHRPVGTPVVTCPVAGRSEGLDFLLETFGAHRIPATFFVEALNHRYFGDEEMGALVHRIAAAGQDVQLHIHPCWTAFRDGALTEDSRDDSCAGRKPEELRDIFREGIAAFERWDLPRPVALRTGGLEADRTVYSVLNELRIPVASNIGVGICPPGDPALWLTGGRRMIDGVMEVPVTTFRDFPRSRPGHLRSLQVTACSWPEIRAVLWQARAQGVETVVLLTHPFEYIKRRGDDWEALRRNRRVQDRLKKLCAFLEAHDDAFVPVSFGERAAEWQAAEAPPADNLAGSDLIALGRMAENFVNDRV